MLCVLLLEMPSFFFFFFPNKYHTQKIINKNPSSAFILGNMHGVGHIENKLLCGTLSI
jgi:hypothetical protein